LKYNEAPADWKIVAESRGLTTELPFTIMEKAAVDVEIINRTMIITNIGNVLYNKTVLVKIGEESLNIYVNLEVDESQKYLLTAPDGEYPVEAISQEGQEVSENVALTGRSISIKEVRANLFGSGRSFIIWIFVILILGFVAFMIFRKVRKKTFAGRKLSFKKKERVQGSPDKKPLIITPNNAELSLSIKGDKQDVTLVCLKVKNLEELTSKKGNGGETLQSLTRVAEKHKVSIYESQDNIFFILAPVKTKTYKNEKAGILIAQELKKILSEHNRLAQQKIDFGISLNHGAIIAKQEGSVLKFMSIGTLITVAKKLASIAKREILLSDKINDRLRSYVKTEKQTLDKVSFYTITHIKKEDDESKKFIRSFLSRMEKKD
jgi:hypothetical protein